MVNLAEDWEILEGYAGDKQGYYQVLSNDGSVEMRVAVGRWGFRREFDKRADPLFSRILAFSGKPSDISAGQCFATAGA